MNIKRVVKKLCFREKADSKSYADYLRKKGLRIGTHVLFTSPRHIFIDLTRPFLITIGDNVVITHGVTILTHGFDWSVMNCKYGDIMGSAGKVEIGNNVFIGVGTIILKGVHIGNNVIIGAGSLVNKDIPDNSVAAGNPARVISDLDTYYKKRQAAQVKEAKELAVEYYKCYGEKPPKEVFHEFFWLFEERKSDGFDNAFFERKMNTNGKYNLAVERFQSTKRVYQDYDSFMKDCFR